MTNIVLKEIQEICSKQKQCYGCDFANNFGVCAFKFKPSQWNLKYITEKLY